MSQFIPAITEALRDLADADNALWMRKYMREKYPFLGVKKPERQEVFKHLYKAVRIISGLVRGIFPAIRDARKRVPICRDGICKTG